MSDLAAASIFLLMLTAPCAIAFRGGPLRRTRQKQAIPARNFLTRFVPFARQFKPTAQPTATAPEPKASDAADIEAPIAQAIIEAREAYRRNRATPQPPTATSLPPLDLPRTNQHAA